jgi:hypothetical protein
LSVAEDWRGRGLGGVLLSELERSARAVGPHLIYGDMLGGNAKMLKLAKRRQYEIVRTPGDWRRRPSISGGRSHFKSLRREDRCAQCKVATRSLHSRLCFTMYQYKAFFSYKRHPLTDEWHRQLMLHIQLWLSQDLGVPDAAIFFDTRSIENAAVIDQAIRDALRTSEVIISVMSPLYFTSAHCLAEIRTFMSREDHLARSRGSLIACARFHDGASYPPPFTNMLSEDFAPFANPAKAFWDSLDGVAF